MESWHIDFSSSKIRHQILSPESRTHRTLLADISEFNLANDSVVESLDELKVTDTFNAISKLLPDKVVTKHGDKTAIVCKDGTKHTFKELTEGINRAGNFMLSVGVRKNDYIMLPLRDSFEKICILYSIMKIGAVLVTNISTGFSEEDILFYMKSSKAKVIICEGDDIEKVLSFINSESTLQIALVSHLKEADIQEELGIEEIYPALSNESISSKLNCAGTTKDDAVMLSFSSATTGPAKPLLVSHRALAGGCFVSEDIFFSSDDIALYCSPLVAYHGYLTGLFTPLSVGASAIIGAPGARAEGYLDKLCGLIGTHKATVFIGFSPILRRILSLPEHEQLKIQERIKSLRYIKIGGEPLSASVHNDWGNISKIRILHTYGASEVGGIASNRIDNIKVGSIGRLRKGISGRILSKEGNIVPRGEIGTLWISSPAIFMEYLNRPELTAKVKFDRWYCTSDFVKMDTEGFLWMYGRASHVIKVAATFVSLLKLKRILNEHESVYDCEVVSVDCFTCPDRMTEPFAVVVLKDRVSTDQAKIVQELKDWIASKFEYGEANKWVPRHFHITDAIPRNKSMKSDIAALKKIFQDASKIC